MSYYNRINQALPMMPPPAPESEIVRADGAVRLEYSGLGAAVFVPGLQAALAGLFVGPAAGLAASMLGHGQAWHVGGLVTFATGAVIYLATLQRWHTVKLMLDSWSPDQPAVQQTTNNVERITIDLRQDNRSIQFIHLAVDADTLAEIARQLLAGQDFAERNFCGAGRPLSQRQFRELRDEFIKRGLLAWRNTDHRQGLDLTRPGRAMFAHLAALPSPSPSAEVMP